MIKPNVLHVRKSGPLLVMRSRFAPANDLVLTVGLGSNRQISFGRALWVDAELPLDGTDGKSGIILHHCGDDSTPWNFNGTYIGGNHGCSDMREVICAGHGLATADLGGEWRDGAGRPFFLIGVPAPDRLWFLSENTGQGDIWRFNIKLVGLALTNAATGAVLALQECRMAQLVPACRINEQKYLLNGKDVLPENTWMECEFLEVLDDYDIISPAAVLRDILDHPGQARDFAAPHLAAVVSNRITHRFYPGGATVIRHVSRALQEFRMGYMGFIQSAPLHKGDFDTHEYYIPGTTAFQQDGINYDFQSIQDFSFKLPKPLNFSMANGNVASADNLPARFIQFLGARENGVLTRKLGYALGYSPVNGITRPAERARNVNTALMLFTSSKSYPHAVDTKMGAVIPAGTEFDCTAYRQYFVPMAAASATDGTATCGTATCVYWHPEGADVLLYADYHKAVEHDVIKLPLEFTGKRIEVLDHTPSVILHTGDTVPEAGLVISVAGLHGCLTARILGGAGVAP